MQSLQLCWITIFLLFKKYNLLLLSSTVQDWIIIRKILLDLLEYNRLICINALSIYLSVAYFHLIKLLGQIFGSFGTDIWIYWDSQLIGSTLHLLSFWDSYFWMKEEVLGYFPLSFCLSTINRSIHIFRACSVSSVLRHSHSLRHYGGHWLFTFIPFAFTSQWCI